MIDLLQPRTVDYIRQILVALSRRDEGMLSALGGDSIGDLERFWEYYDELRAHYISDFVDPPVDITPFLDCYSNDVNDIVGVEVFLFDRTGISIFKAYFWVYVGDREQIVDFRSFYVP